MRPKGASAVPVGDAIDRKLPGSIEVVDPATPEKRPPICARGYTHQRPLPDHRGFLRPRYTLQRRIFRPLGYRIIPAQRLPAWWPCNLALLARAQNIRTTRRL